MLDLVIRPARDGGFCVMSPAGTLIFAGDLDSVLDFIEKFYREAMPDGGDRKG